MATDLSNDKYYLAIAQKVEQLMKRLIKAKGLIKTGKMYKSINVKPDSTGAMIVDAVDYFVYVNGRYGLTDEVFGSRELNNFVKKAITQKIKDDLNNIDLTD